MVILWLVISGVIAGVITFGFMVFLVSYVWALYHALYQAFSGYEFYLFFIVFYMFTLYNTQKLFLKDRISTEDAEKISEMMLFSGNVDRKTGFIEGTARNVEMEADKKLRIVRIRVEIFNESGDLKEYVPVEIHARLNKWVGSITDGDRIRTNGTFRNGTIFARSAYNFTTKSLVGEQ